MKPGEVWQLSFVPSIGGEIRKTWRATIGRLLKGEEPKVDFGKH